MIFLSRARSEVVCLKARAKTCRNNKTNKKNIGKFTIRNRVRTAAGGQRASYRGRPSRTRPRRDRASLTTPLRRTVTRRDGVVKKN